VTTRLQSGWIKKRNIIDIYIHIRTPTQNLTDSNPILILLGTHDQAYVLIFNCHDNGTFEFLYDPDVVTD